MGKQPGYKDKLYYDAYGATATTLVLNVKDLDLDPTVDYAETTDRGTGVYIPRKDRVPVAQDVKITWSMNVKTSDTTAVALLAAATNKTPTPVALKYVSGLGATLFDGDCFVKAKNSATLSGAAAYDFEAIPTTEGGRDYIINGT